MTGTPASDRHIARIAGRLVTADKPTAAGVDRHERQCAAGVTNGAARCQCVTPPDAGVRLSDAEAVEHDHAGPDWRCEACKPLADVLRARMRWPSIHWGTLHDDAYPSLARAIHEAGYTRASTAQDAGAVARVRRYVEQSDLFYGDEHRDDVIDTPDGGADDPLLFSDLRILAAQDAEAGEVERLRAAVEALRSLDQAMRDERLRDPSTYNLWARVRNVIDVALDNSLAALDQAKGGA